MNFCLIDPHFAKEEHVGTTTYNFYLALGLIKQGHRVHVICNNGPAYKKISSKNLVVHRIGKASNSRKAHKSSSKDLFGFKTLIYLTVYIVWQSFIYYRKYKEISAKEHIDVIESADSLFAFWFIIFCRKKLVIRVHGPWSLIWKLNKKHLGIADKLVFFLERFQMKITLHLTTPSEFMVDFINNYFRTSKKITVIKNPIDISFIDRKSQVEKNTFFYLGRLEPNKGITQVLKLAKRFPKLPILIAGEIDDHFDQRVLLSIRKAPNIDYLGPLAYSQLLDRIAGAEYILAPSKFENCSYAILESLALGKIVLASDNAGNRLIINDGYNGFLVKNFELFLQRRLINYKHKTKIRLNAYKTARQYDIKNLMPAYLKYYRKIANV